MPAKGAPRARFIRFCRTDFVKIILMMPIPCRREQSLSSPFHGEYRIRNEHTFWKEGQPFHWETTRQFPSRRLHNLLASPLFRGPTRTR